MCGYVNKNNVVIIDSVDYNSLMGFGKISKSELNNFYQSKFDYFKTVSAYSALLIGFLEMTYFYSDCQLYGRLAVETIIPRFFIIIPIVIFIILYPRINNYKQGVLLYYIMPHAAMWCTIWSIYHLENKDFAREGFIIMHFAFLAIGLAMPLVYHIPIHACLILNIVISNFWNHYESFSLMISLALPVYFGVSVMLYILESSYADQYLVKKELEKSMVTDNLTGVYNRYKLNELIEEDKENFKIEGDIVVLMFDIDHFKTVNDTYGHEAGDKILKFVADQIKLYTFSDDYIVRWGGEEFVVILVGYTIKRAMAAAERLRAAVEASDNGICPITISVGVCEYQNGTNHHETIDNADCALYYAKKHGRNRVINYEDIK